MHSILKTKGTKLQHLKLRCYKESTSVHSKKKTPGFYAGILHLIENLNLHTLNRIKTCTITITHIETGVQHVQ